LAERLFLYGTLQFPEMMRAVLGRTLPVLPAELPDFDRFQVRRRVFPAILPAPGSRVPGLIVDHVDAWTLERIDDYEGPPFYRHRTTVRLPEVDDHVEATVYLLRQRYHCLLLDRDWDPEQFRREWHDWYVREYQQVYATGPGHEASDT
jgi:gamma-glutamylcyclotransferase (GGCT)/AIG2-like uncharacterized protein YtfP